MAPTTEKGAETQQDVNQQSAEDLPGDGIRTVTEEAGQPEALLDLREEDLDVPAATIEIANSPGTLGRVVGDEDHQTLLAIDLDPCLDTPHDYSFLGQAHPSDF